MEEGDNCAWISGSLQLQNQSKPQPNQSSQPSFAAECNEDALWAKLQTLNERQHSTLTGTQVTEVNSKEEEFVRLILTIEAEKLSKELFSLLFDLLISNSYSTEQGKATKGDFLFIFFKLLRDGKCEVLVEVALLKELNNLVSSSTRIKRHCCSKKWVLRLLQMLPTVEDDRILNQFVLLIKTLGTFSISTHEMQTIFRMMNTESSLFKPERLAVLLDIMRSISQRIGPDIYFDFNGRNAGIQLSPLSKGWPGGEGYGFCTWLRIESFEDPAGGRHYQPHLFSFTSREGTGLEAYFINRILHIRVSMSKSKILTVQLEHTFVPGTWYFLFVSHVYHFIRRSEISLYLDGKLVSTHALNYPKADKPLVQAIIGNSSSVFRKQPTERHQPFFGQMSQIFFFASPVPKHEDVHTIYMLGPNFVPLIDPAESKIIAGVSQSNQFLLDGRRSLKIQCSFNPKAIYSNNRLLDTSSLDLKDSATVQPGTTSVRTHGIKETLYCTGGIRVLLPLFKTLDQPIMRGIAYGSETTSTDSAKELISTVDPNFALQVFTLLQNMLKNNSQNQQQMVLAHGFQVIGYLLESINPQCWTTSTLHVLEQLAQTVIGCEPLFRQLFLHVYLNFHIWVYTHPEVQKELFDLIIQHVKKNPAYFRSLITIQRMVDILRHFYWFAPESLSEAIKPILNPTTFETLGKRPDHHIIKMLRVSILQLSKLMAYDGFTLDETRAFVYYLQDCQDPEQGVDVLQMILSALTTPRGKTKNEILPWLCELGGLSPFISLLQRPSIMLRIWSIKIIGKLLQLSQSKRKEKLTANNRLLLVKHSLEQFPFNETTYFALLEILVECVNNREFKNPLHNEEQEFFIKNPVILSVIFEMLCTSGQSNLQYKVLQDFVYLLNQSAENRSMFIRQPFWQNWLLGLLANNATPSNSSSEVFKQIVKLLTLLFHHCLSETNGWKVFVDSQGLLNYFGAQGFFDCVEITRDINTSVLRTVAYDARILQTSQNDASTWENLVKWLSFTEECLFVSQQATETLVPQDDHFLLGIHRRYDGMWIDFEFAQKLLDFLDSLLLSPTATDETRPSVPHAEENLIRLALRLTLYTLFETDAFLNTEKIQERSKNLKNVEGAVDEYFTDQEFYPRVKEGLSNYLQGKIKQWNSEMNSVDKVFQKNIDRLRQLVQRLIQMDGEVNRLMYIISFLYRAMKRSYEHQGIGAELILNVFKEILVSCRSILPLSPELTTMNEGQYVEFFMRHFAFPNENPALFKRFDDGVKQVLFEEQQYSMDTHNKLQENIVNICKAVKLQHENELAQVEKSQQENTNYLATYRINENERIMQYKRDCSQNRRSLAKKTKSILNELSHERGPWATPESIVQPIHWKLSKVECPISRKRMKLTRNRNFDSHEQCAKGGELRESTSNVSLNLLNSLHVSQSNVSAEVLVDEETQQDLPHLVTNNESKMIFECSCDLITPLTVTHGNFELTPSNIYFIVTKDAKNTATQPMSHVKLKQPTSQKWSIRSIKYIHARRYLLRNNGLEIFLSDHTNYFLNFSSTRVRDLVWRKLMSLKPPNLVDFGSGGSITNITGFGTPPSGAQLLKRMNITRRWKNREISNFDYLMWLNTLAGRTYNDLTQYPIFPWVIQDYESETLDLENPQSFRDLSKPVGALNPERLQQFVERYNAFDDPSIPKFHYGSHYSNVGVVLYYLLRLEPFTSYFLTMQGGKFDHPTRMFMSIPDTWKNCLTNSSDVKELIPEFFYLPEFLENQNDFCFGYYNSQEVRCDVELPRWASSTHDFVSKHREALESDYVSDHLHEWIDLIFGFKQRGPEAEAAHNLFFYLTYEGVIDIDSIEDPVERQSIEAQIINFGQTPSQLFDKAHPKRKSKAELPATKQLAAFKKHGISPFYDLQCKVSKAIIFVQFCAPDKLVFVTMDGVIGVNLFSPKIDRNGAFLFDLDKSLNTKHQKRIDMIYPEAISAPSRCFVVSKDAKVLFSCGMWNDDIQARHFSQPTKYSSAEHRDIVNCVCMTHCGNYLVSGSKDCTVVVWQINTASSSPSSAISSFWSSNKSSKNAQIFKVKHILYGHTDTVTCVDVSSELDVVISGSKDRSLILYNLNSGKYLRSISMQNKISQVYISREGYFVVYCDEAKTLSLYSINGRLLEQCNMILSRVLSSVFSPDGKYFVNAGVGNAVVVRKIPSFQIVYIYEVPCAVFSIDFAPGPELSFLLLGMMNTQLRILPFDASQFFDHQPPTTLL